MKKLVILALVLGIFGIANAENLRQTQTDKATKTRAIQKIQNIDLESLFGSSNVNAIALSQEEMEATKGEGWFSWLNPLRWCCLFPVK